VREALHAEWTKARTVSAVGWLLLAAVALTVALGAMASAESCPDTSCGRDLAKLSLTGVQLGQVIVAVVAVFAIGSEYGTGLIRVTLAAMPRRPVLFGAKATVLTGLVLAAGAVAVVPSVLIGRIFLHSNGFSATDGATLRAAGGSVLYLALIALLAFGIATAVRDSAVAIGIVLGLLYLFPILAGVITDQHWQRRLDQIGPTNAGLAVQATKNLSTLPIGPWAGLGVLAAWAGGVLLIGAAVLQFRDA
jgi:ABC-2 type transport system permease protein